MNQFRSPKRTANEFAIPIPHSPLPIPHSIRVIEAINGQIITGQLRATPKIENGRVIADVANDVLKIALVDRYGGGPPAVGFIKNFGLKQGAIASSVSHDSHNLLAVGVDDQSIAKAMNLLIDCQGGISAVGELDGKPVEAVLPLPIAGLMSPAEGSHVAHEYSRIDALAKKLGTKLVGALHDSLVHGAIGHSRTQTWPGRSVRRRQIPTGAAVGVTDF